MREQTAELPHTTSRPRPAPGFSQITSPGRYLLVANWLEASVARLGLLEAKGLQRTLAHPSGGQGRSETAVVPLPGSEVRLHVRPFRRGGWLAELRGHRLLRLNRLVSELHTTAKLAATGAPVPMPALVVAHQKGRLWNAAVATIFEEESVDAGAWLQSSPSATRLLAAAAAAGNAIRRFHDAGGCHRDLHVGNLLVRERAGQTEIIVIDLDGAKVLPSVSPARRMRELMRLHRSLIKRGWATTLGPRVYAEFFKAYTQGDHPLRRELLRHHPRERFRLALHVAGYKIRERSLNA